tara:strand:- start:879 stop:1157 length:279 start_codon:yes stop_codon:yes gene_type:complete
MNMSYKEKLRREWIECDCGFSLNQVEKYGGVRLNDKQWEFLNEDICEVLEDHFIDIKKGVIYNYFNVDKHYEIYKDGPEWTEFELHKIDEYD